MGKKRKSASQIAAENEAAQLDRFIEKATAKRDERRAEAERLEAARYMGTTND